jgi:hypothetical protein
MIGKPLDNTAAPTIGPKMAPILATEVAQPAPLARIALG